MSFSGGTFSINSSGQPVVTGTVISSTAFNALTADLATGLSTCILKDGTQTLTANIPMGGFKLTGLGAGSSNGDSLRYEQLVGAYIANALLTTTGDSIVASAPSTPARLAAKADVAAHATTSDIWVAREIVLTGGAVTFTDVADAPYVGAVAWVKANAAHVITTGGTMTVQGGATITLAAGDWVRFYATTVATFEVTVFRLSGRPAIPLRTRQVFTSGTAQTYTTPTGCIAINVRMVGGGGGGGAQATNAGANGTASTWSGGSLSAGLGVGGAAAGGAGGTGGASTNGDINIPGGAGEGGFTQSAGDVMGGGIGGATVFGGAGMGEANAAGGNAATNSGAGGAGGGATDSSAKGAGGGSGGYVEKLITSPAATYTYTVGAGGAGGAAGTKAGGNGAAGIIIVDEFYS